ncbi:MAG TPA: DUF6584 family protein [Fimbriimonadaceae bacterium]|nr:DUF6584 family protein [Fimbriimonadaceae bacterium]
MRPPPALDKAKQEIAEGKLGIARDRLHGLVNTYPENLALRSLPGDVYWKLGYPAEAGRFWFLDHELTDERREAISAFLSRCGGDPRVILHNLKLRPPLEAFTEKEVREKIDELLRAIGARELPVRESSARNVPSVGWMYGCVAAFVGVLILGIIGAITVLRHFRP